MAFLVIQFCQKNIEDRSKTLHISVSIWVKQKGFFGWLLAELVPAQEHQRSTLIIFVSQ